uniref:Uncharacterized protein n=1 Tax=Homalodisca liturata TaxID=320908 RepID=A0A1B6HRR3_9HEMI
MVPLLVLLHVPLYVTQQVAEPPPGCGVYHTNFTITPQWEKLFSAGRNLTMFYKNPSRGYGPGHEMVRTAMIYLEQMEELEQAVDENRSTALDAVWELYLCGGPLHLRQIPYGEFIRIFKWDSTDIDEYFTLINQTRKIWNRLVEELQRIADPDLII